MYNPPNSDSDSRTVKRFPKYCPFAVTWYNSTASFNGFNFADTVDAVSFPISLVARANLNGFGERIFFSKDFVSCAALKSPKGIPGAFTFSAGISVLPMVFKSWSNFAVPTYPFTAPNAPAGISFNAMFPAVLIFSSAVGWDKMRYAISPA